MKTRNLKLRDMYPLKGIYREDAKIGKFLSCILLTGLAYGLYRGIQDNYLAEVVLINEFERGVVEFFRELPGLLVVLILAWMHSFSDDRIYKVGVGIMAAGLAGFFLGGTGKGWVILFMVIYSAGEHIVMPVKSTISLERANRDKGGVSLGLTSGITHVGNIIGYVAVSVIFLIFSRRGYAGNNPAQFKFVFALGCALMIAAFCIVVSMDEIPSRIKRRPFYFDKKFRKFYMLEIFYGARKQVFYTFAPYVMILQYGADTALIAFLMAVCAGFGIFCGPLIGKLIDRLGYKVVMVTDTLILVVVCFFYGFAHRLFPPNIAFAVVCVNYVLDSIISLASMASHVYVQDIAETKEEITAAISTGISVNHFISILIALLGGWIWKITGVEVLFSLSAVLGIINSLYAASIKKKNSAESYD